MDFDFNERTINLLESIHVPNTYWLNKSSEYKYWFRSLLHKIDSSIIFRGLPDKWNNDFLMLCLWSRGFVVVFESNRTALTDRYGPNVLFQPCELAGELDFYYQPKAVTIANPYFNGTLDIGKKAELLKLTPDFMGVFDILAYYSEKLAEISKGIDMGLINAKMPVILTASNEAQSNTLKKVYDKVQSGESLVVYKDLLDSDEIMPRKSPFEAWTQDFKQTYIVHNLLEDMQLILNSFYMEIGLPVANEKKERLVTTEADFASAQSQARISCWYETISECLRNINKSFNLNIEVEYACKINADRNDDGIGINDTSKKPK